MPCTKLSSGKTVCYGDEPTTYSQGGTIFFNHQPVHFKDGGKTDDVAFKKFVSTLPPNLRNTGSDYNLKGYWESLGKPSAFDYSQPKESDGMYHAYSRNSETGEILKKPNHPTFGQALEEDRKIGYYPYQSPSGVMHTFKPNEVPQGFKVPIYPTLNNIKKDGGKNKFNFPVSKERQLAEQARMQGDMPTAPGVVKAQEKVREQEAVKRKLANQPIVTLSDAQKKDIDDKNLKEDLLVEMIRRNQQSLSNPDDRSIEADIAQDLNENGAMGLIDAPIKGATALLTGRYQTPSQAIGRWANQNNHQMLRNAMIDDQFNPTGLGMATEIFGPMALGQILPKGADLAAKALGTEEGLLSNAYRINPNAVKNNPQMYLYRTETKNFPTKMLSEEENLKSIIEKGGLSPMQEMMLKSKLSKIQNNPDADVAALNKYFGQWFDNDPSRMDWYMRGRLDGNEGNILRLKVPTEEGLSYNLKNFPDAQKASASIETEFIVPRDRRAQAEVFSTNDYQRLVNEDKAFNKPHWWKGFKQDGGKNSKTIRLSTGKIITLK